MYATELVLRSEDNLQELSSLLPDTWVPDLRFGSKLLNHLASS